MLVQQCARKVLLVLLVLVTVLMNWSAATEVPRGVAADDWSSILELYRAQRNLLVPSVTGHVGRNDRQDWNLSFDGRGFEVRGEGMSWGLDLLSYGRLGAERRVAETECTRADENRLVYSWDDSLEEWYVNDSRGVEHGFTVHQPPAQNLDRFEQSPLSFTLRVRGDLTARVDDSGSALNFFDSSGISSLTYEGLTVIDAEGVVLPAWFELCDAGIRILVDDNDASYPLLVDPIAQRTYLKSSNSDPGDEFGYDVAICGNTLVVSAPAEDSNATGSQGDQSDNSLSRAGAAYVFVKNGATWSQEAYLKPSSTDILDNFGWSVGISGDTIIVGAERESSDATGVNGDDTNNDADESGAAYIFRRSGTTWTQEAYLKASHVFDDRRFGWDVDVSGDTAVVSSYLDASSSTGVGGDPTDLTKPNSGAVWAFRRTGTTWSQDAYIKASNTDTSDNFGWSISLDDDVLVVGAINESSNATGVNGIQINNLAVNAGAAYVFRRSGTGWSQEAYLKASGVSEGDRFGHSVSIDADTIIVSAVAEESASSGVNGDDTDDSLKGAGAAYVFVHDGTNWTQQAYLKASNPGFGYGFGSSVAVSGDRVIVTSIGEPSGSSGVNPPPTSAIEQLSGAAYCFARSGSSWNQEAFIKASNVDRRDFFGSATAIDADVAVVSAIGEDSGSTGAGGDQFDESADGSGAVYIFDFDPDDEAGQSFCFGDGGDQMGCTNCPCGNNAPPGTPGGCLNSVSDSARLLSSGDVSVSLPSNSTDDLRFALSSAPPSSFSVLFSGSNLAPTNPGNPCSGIGSGVQTVLYDGLRCAISGTRRHGGRAVDPTGNVGVTTPAWGGGDAPPAGIARAGVGFVAGQTRYFQAVYRDDMALSCMRGLNTSQAVRILFSP